MDKWTEQSFFKGRSPNGKKKHEKMLNIPTYFSLLFSVASTEQYIRMICTFNNVQ
jgi:hypothetical protein